MQKQSWRLWLAGLCLHLDQAAQRAEAAKLQDPSECPHGERTAAVPGAGAAEAFTKTGRTLQSCKCGKKTSQKARKRKISSNVCKGLRWGSSFLKSANQRGQPMPLLFTAETSVG